MAEISRQTEHRGGGKEMGTEGPRHGGGAGRDAAAAGRVEERRGTDGAEALAEGHEIDRGGGMEKAS